MGKTSVTALASGPVCQVAVVVRDVEAKAKAYADLFGLKVPAVHLTGPQEESHSRYRGKPTDGRAKLAFIQLENLSLELIEPVGGPSTWQEFLDAHGEGVHHIAFRIKDTDGHIAMLAKKGIPLVQRGDFKGGVYSYFDGSEKLGMILELLENRDG